MSASSTPGWRRWAALAAVALLGVAGGATMTARRSAPVPAAGTPRAATAECEGRVDSPGPRRMVDGVGVGFSHDEAGAVAAAVSYTTAPQAWLYRADDQVQASAEAVTVPEARDDLVPDLVEDARLLRDEVAKASGTVWFVVAPLATRVETYRPRQAVIRVWAARVLSADGVAVPQSGWHTVTFELAWDNADWRIAGVDEAEGPTPQLEAGLQPWAADYLDEELTGFIRVGTS